MTSPLQQKLKINGPVVVTANRLADGAVVYRGEGGWTTKLDSADLNWYPSAAPTFKLALFETGITNGFASKPWIFVSVK